MDGPKPLHIREWTCPACGALLDRDINSARNVKKAAGLAVSACGAPMATTSAARSSAQPAC
ncbi:zinc ribbon domain-containing protein [Streptomyces yaanensis]|uniref:Zinc ribbon domain-containing protein n=1 Tax=Streptomyces yaanensis TaxID=1142239 RepID=A0ABV7SCZ1_9ACTN